MQAAAILALALALFDPAYAGVIDASILNFDSALQNLRGLTSKTDALRALLANIQPGADVPTVSLPISLPGPTGLPARPSVGLPSALPSVPLPVSPPSLPTRGVPVPSVGVPTALPTLPPVGLPPAVSLPLPPVSVPTGLPALPSVGVPVLPPVAAPSRLPGLPPIVIPPILSISLSLPNLGLPTPLPHAPRSPDALDKRQSGSGGIFASVITGLVDLTASATADAALFIALPNIGDTARQIRICDAYRQFIASQLGLQDRLASVAAAANAAVDASVASSLGGFSVALGPLAAAVAASAPTCDEVVSSAGQLQTALDRAIDAYSL